jgi:integrase
VKIRALGHGLGSVWQRTKDGAFEHVHVDKATGRQVCVTLSATTKTAALKEASERVGKVERGETVAPSRLTFDQVAEMFFDSFEARVISGERKRRTLDDYRWRYDHHIKPRLGHVPAQRINRTHALSLLDDLRREGLSTSTLSAVHRTLSVIVSDGRDRGILTADVALGSKRITVENKREVRELTAEELAAVLDAAQDRWRLMFRTAAGTGARASELLGLTWADFDKDAGTLSITKQLSREGTLIPPKTKNGKRTIQVAPGLVKALVAARLASEYSADADFIFAADTEPVGRYGLARRAFTRAVEKAGIEFDVKTERISMHVFRHTAASRLIKVHDPATVAAYLGDDVATVVKHYIHVHRDGSVNIGEALAS